MASSFEGTITKYKRKPNLLEDFIEAIETGNNSIIKEAGNVIYSEYENWAKENKYAIYPSGFLPNLDENNEIVSYSMPSYGYAWVDRQEIEGQSAKITAGLLKTYNRLYFLLDTKDLDVITLAFQNIGKRINELEKDPKTSVDYIPRIWGGIVPKNLFNEDTFKEFLNQPDEEVMKKTQRVMQLTDKSLSANFSTLELDLRDLEDIAGTECYVVITNIESGDLWENSEFDPNNDTEPAFTPYYTCSAPDLIEVQSIVFNKAPTIPSNIELYHNGDTSLYPDIPKEDIIEGVETCIEWTPSEDIDETPELDTLNMGSFILPPGLSRGDINKDGKIDIEDYNRLDQIVKNNETLNDDGFGMWAAIITELGAAQNNQGTINNNSVILMNKHLNGTSQIESDIFRGNNWDCEWKVDINNNLYYIDIPDERIHPEVKIELYNEYLYDLGTLQKIECYDKYFRIYLNCCPTNNLFIEDNYDSENNGILLQKKWEELKKLESTKKIFNVEYKIITESYKKNLLKRNKSDNIVYELILEYDNEDIEKYWILPKDKDYLDMGFIQDLYYEYCFVYSERSAEENYNKFLKLLPQKALIGYQRNENGKLVAILPAISEEEQYQNGTYMFKTKLTKAKMASIDYYGAKSIFNSITYSNRIVQYLNNSPPSVPNKVNFLQSKNSINVTGFGAIDNDLNTEYKKPLKDLIRYHYQYKTKNGTYIDINFIDKIELDPVPTISLGDYTRQGKINDLSLIRLSAYMHQNFIPSMEERNIFHDLTGEKQINQEDIKLLKKYINNEEHIVFPGLLTYNFETGENPWRLIPELGLYMCEIAISGLPDETSPICVNLYNSYLYDLKGFVKGEMQRGTMDPTSAWVKLYFKEVPALFEPLEINYSVEKNLTKDEVKLYKYTQWYPTPATFTINKRPDGVEYITVRARATDRMAWSDWKEFEGVAYPDIWLGTRNCLIGGLNDIMIGSPYIISATPPVSEKDKEKLWYCNDPSNERYETLSIWNGTEWVPNTTVNSLKNKNVWYKSATPPSDTSIFWIDTDDDEGGLKHYENGEWVPVSVIWS